MATRRTGDFLSGVIEGFYGPPWSQTERLELFGWMAKWGLNTYVYAPKDDLKHRALWRERYTPAESTALGAVCRACTEHGIRFVYALSPGLDIRYSRDTEMDSIRRRFTQVQAMGCRDFALLFDDIPDRLETEDDTRFGSFAAAQSHVVNGAFRWLREQVPTARLLFCPTAYCGMMADRKLGGGGYLERIGRELLPEIDIFWTGPDIISRELTVPHVRVAQNLLRRKPLIWDNLFANDYDGRRFYCGPYSRKRTRIRKEVSGLLLNPNTEFPLNYVPLRTFAAFLRCRGEWSPRTAYLSAMAEWHPSFATVGQPVSLADLVLFGDCYYLPHENGPEAEKLYKAIRASIAGAPARKGRRLLFPVAANRLHAFCVRMTELRHRPLFHALSRRIWDLREELALLESYAGLKSAGRAARESFRSDFHLSGTYRGGMVSRLQELLVQCPDGTFKPAKASTKEGI
jgi:protein O-GlcNAcase/histone acetyltransferase